VPLLHPGPLTRLVRVQNLQFIIFYLNKAEHRHAVELTPRTVEVGSGFGLLLSFVVVNEVKMDDELLRRAQLRLSGVSGSLRCRAPKKTGLAILDEIDGQNRRLFRFANCVFVISGCGS